MDSSKLKCLKHSDILIFDYDGTYKQLDNDSEIVFLDIKNLPFNPFALHENTDPITVGNKFKFTMAKYAHLHPQQQGVLIDAIMKAYEEKKITYKDSHSWSNIAPTIKDVIGYIDYKEDSEAYIALQKLITLNIATFTDDMSLLDFIHGIKIIDLSKIDLEIQDLIVAIVLDALSLELCTTDLSNKNQKYIQIEERDHLNCYRHTSLIDLLDQGGEGGITILMN